jgi:hypothetical protein
VNERKRFAGVVANPVGRGLKDNFGHDCEQGRISTASASWKERSMRILWAVITGLALLAAPMAPGDDQSGICVGGMEVVACVPPESS